MSHRARKDIDAALLERCRQGEEAARRELFHATREDTRRILLRLAGPDDQLEDLMQNAYLALFKSLGYFRGECALRTWLYGICLRVVRKYRRLSFRRRRFYERYRSLQVESGQEPPQTEQERRAEAVWRALDRLSIKHREILVLFEMEELDGREIAQLLNIPEGTVWTRLHHARRVFKKEWLRLGCGGAG